MPAWPKSSPPAYALGMGLATVAAGSAITVEVLPEPSYVEVTDGAQVLNCDLLVANASRMTWTLSMIEVSVFDGGGVLGWRRFLDGNGVSPGITIVPNRELPACTRVLVLNPLHSFPLDLDLGRVRFELTYERDDDTQTIAAVDIQPVVYELRSALHLPLRGRIIVWDGHDFGAHHRRWDYLREPIRELGFDSNAARYSYDLIPTDDHGAMAHGDPKRNESWIGYGRPIFAPAAGAVVAVVDDRPDDRQIDMGAMKQDLLAIFGNYVIVDHGSREFSVLGHLQRASARVAVGTTVTAGQELAAIGGSGSSLMPHLHYQLQTDASGHAEGLPSYFAGFQRIRGGTAVQVKRGQIDSGELLESLSC